MGGGNPSPYKTMRFHEIDLSGREPDNICVFGAYFGKSHPGVLVRFPCWLYKDNTEPLKVNNDEEEKAAREKGYDSVTASTMANKYLANWFWDLEDFSPKQLVVFAKDEFDVDLPIEAGQDRLFKAVVELSRCAPQNQNRLVLMAHTVKLNYDATLEEIRRLINCDDDNVHVERSYEEVYA
jgi:hypothetical protein